MFLQLLCVFAIAVKGITADDAPYFVFGTPTCLMTRRFTQPMDESEIPGDWSRLKVHSGDKCPETTHITPSLQEDKDFWQNRCNNVTIDETYKYKYNSFNSTSDIRFGILAVSGKSAHILGKDCEIVKLQFRKHDDYKMILVTNFRGHDPFPLAVQVPDSVVSRCVIGYTTVKGKKVLYKMSYC